MDEGTFDAFLDAVHEYYEDTDDVTVTEMDGSAGRTVRVIVVRQIKEAAEQRANAIVDDVASQFNGRARHVATYAANEDGDRAAEVLAVPEHA